jgi:hypothetical protein
VIQGWPGESPPPLPCVAVDIDKTKISGFQLGGGSKDTIKGTIHVFATSEAEKKDLTDLIYQSLFNKSLTINNWHEGDYLDYNGTYTGFTPAPVPGISSGFFKEVDTSFTSQRLSWSELNRHRAKVEFVFEVHKD